MPNKPHVKYRQSQTKTFKTALRIQENQLINLLTNLNENKRYLWVEITH